MLAVKSMDVRDNFKSFCDKVFSGETLIISNDVMQTGRYDTNAGSRSLLGLTPDSYAGGNFIQSASSNFLGQRNPYSANQGVTYLTAEQIANDPLQNLVSGNGKNVNQFGDRSALPYMAWMERTQPVRAAALNDAAEYGSYLY